MNVNFDMNTPVHSTSSIAEQLVRAIHMVESSIEQRYRRNPHWKHELHMDRSIWHLIQQQSVTTSWIDPVLHGASPFDNSVAWPPTVFDRYIDDTGYGTVLIVSVSERYEPVVTTVHLHPRSFPTQAKETSNV